MDRSIVILTGAGVSAESGLKTFRDQNGLWENHRVEDVASIEGFLRDPDVVQRFYNARREQLFDPIVQPNPAHFALADLERQWKGSFLLVTQNVDNLHERAGSKNLIHMHGELAKVRCQNSGDVLDWSEPILKNTACPCCQLKGTLRPHIVWFGEMPMQMDRIFERLESCDIFVAIGTSGQVYPAAGFIHHVPAQTRTIEVNPEPSAISSAFKEILRGKASEKVPEFVRSLIE